VVDLRQIVDDADVEPELRGEDRRRRPCPSERAGEDGIDAFAGQEKRVPAGLFDAERCEG
jgi:hypothetical protein